MHAIAEQRMLYSATCHCPDAKVHVNKHKAIFLGILGGEGSVDLYISPRTELHPEATILQAAATNR